MNDNELLALLKSDPERGLAMTVAVYSAYVQKIAYARLSDVCTQEDIEEIVSDVFLIFYNTGKKNGFEIRSLKAILSIIAKRRCIDCFRTQSNCEQTASYDDLENYISDDLADNACLLEAISRLGEPDSSIFVRKYYFGQKNIDIAKDLGMNVNTLNTRLSRGLKKLRKMLEEGL